MKKYKILAGLVLMIALGAAVGYFLRQNKNQISQEQAKDKAQKFVSENLVQPDTEVAVKGVTDENGLYRFELDVSGQEIVAYMTKDGKNFFPQAMNMDEFEKEKKQQAEEAEQKANVEVPKTDKPAVEAFVMSYCPYGTQIEKGLLPVIDALGDKIDFRLKFVDYAMHEKKEIDENLVQYCIQKNESANLSSYLECFLKDSEKAAECLKEADINQSSLESCISASDKEFQITEKYNDKNTWKSQFPPFDVDKADNEKYNVQGSPTLIVNGAEVQAERDPASLLATICKGFSSQPDQCSVELSSETPAPGFGEGTASAATSGGGCEN